MASEILFNLISEYAGPILNASGYKISPLGFIESFNGEKICYQNPKYVSGVNDPQNPPIIYPVVPIDDKSYLNIKATPEYELYNPFQTFKQMCILLLKLKKVLIPFFISEEKLNNVDEDDYDQFDDMFQMYNKRDETGEYEVGVVCLEDQQHPKEIMKFSSDNINKSVWGLCVEIYNNFCDSTQLKQFKNIDRSWSKIQKLCDEWDKARRSLMSNVSVEHENVYNPESMNYSGEETSENTYDDTDFLSGYKFIVPNDPMDKNDKVLQDYLTNMFPQHQLEPYVEQDPDDDVSLETENEMVLPDTSMPEEVLHPENKSLIEVVEEKDKEEAAVEGAKLQTKMEEDNEVQQEEKRGVFSYASNNNQQTVQQPMFGMNPMIGGAFNPYGMGMMNPMNMGMNNMPGSNINEMNLDRNFVDPFAMYR